MLVKGAPDGNVLLILVQGPASMTEIQGVQVITWKYNNGMVKIYSDLITKSSNYK